MSQDEVLRCLVKLNGSAWHDDITNEYNKIHFPRNTNYKDIEKITVKKTLQGDLSKLLKFGFISRVYRKPPERRQGSRCYRIEGYYSITALGLEYIQKYNIITACQ